MLISSLRHLTGSYSHFNIYIANFTMYSLKCHTEDVRGVREDVDRKERILYWFLLRLDDFHDYLYKGFHNSYFKGSYSDSDSHMVKFTKILLKSLQKAIPTLSKHIYPFTVIEDKKSIQWFGASEYRSIPIGSSS